MFIYESISPSIDYSIFNEDFTWMNETLLTLNNFLNSDIPLILDEDTKEIILKKAESIIREIEEKILMVRKKYTSLKDLNTLYSYLSVTCWVLTIIIGGIVFLTISTSVVGFIIFGLIAVLGSVSAIVFSILAGNKKEKMAIHFDEMESLVDKLKKIKTKTKDKEVNETLNALIEKTEDDIEKIKNDDFTDKYS